MHSNTSPKTQKGTVKWFNNAKGYGFIKPGMGGEDFFVHYSYIDMAGYKTLKAGQPVIFEVKEAPKGYHAVDVILLDESNDVEEPPIETDLSLEIPTLTDIVFETEA